MLSMSRYILRKGINSLKKEEVAVSLQKYYFRNNEKTIISQTTAFVPIRLVTFKRYDIGERW